MPEQLRLLLYRLVGIVTDTETSTWSCEEMTSTMHPRAGTASGAPVTADIDQGRAGAREWIALAVLMLPVLLVAVDATVLSFALPSISEALNPSGTQLLWMI